MERNIIAEQEAFLDETVSYFSEDVNRRCSNGKGRCYYNPADIDKEDISEGCAIGRLMTQAQKEEADFNDSVGVLPKHLIPERLKDFNLGFLRKVQALHDKELYWTKDGLSSWGKDMVESIRTKFLTVE
jgi:hypothetical protein